MFGYLVLLQTNVGIFIFSRKDFKKRRERKNLAGFAKNFATLRENYFPSTANRFNFLSGTILNIFFFIQQKNLLNRFLNVGIILRFTQRF